MLQADGLQFSISFDIVRLLGRVIWEMQILAHNPDLFEEKLLRPCSNAGELLGEFQTGSGQKMLLEEEKKRKMVP